jgi:hypothetical protein
MDLRDTGTSRWRSFSLTVDEFQDLLKTVGIEHVIGVQCPFGSVSSKPTSWVSHGVDLSDMPRECKHSKKPWYNNRTGAAVVSSHRPTAGCDTYSDTAGGGRTDDPVGSSTFVSASLAAYPDLLNRYLVSKLSTALAASNLGHSRDVASGNLSGRVPSTVMLNPAPRNFSEQIEWRQRLRGTVEIDEKAAADHRAIGGMRNAAEAVGKLHTVQAFGKALGNDIRMALLDDLARATSAGHGDQAWIHQTCGIIGTTSKEARPPSEAIDAVKRILLQHIGGDGLPIPDAKTSINAKMLGSWRLMAGDPDDQVEIWLVKGAPAGILSPAN